MDSNIAEAYSRSSHPSAAQVEMLVDFVEANPEIAKGFSKTARARARTIARWEDIGRRLNSIEGGTIKTFKKWTKYWSDKKSAVRKKVASRNASKCRTDGRMDDDAFELSEVEERIAALIFTHNGIKKERITRTPSKSPERQVTPPPPVNAPRAAPVKTERAPNRLWRARPHESTIHCNTTTTQRRTQLISVTEKFMRLEEQRIQLDSRVVTVLEQNADRERLMAEAALALGEGMKALAEAISRNR